MSWEASPRRQASADSKGLIPMQLSLLEAKICVVDTQCLKTLKRPEQLSAMLQGRIDALAVYRLEADGD